MSGRFDAAPVHTLGLLEPCLCLRSCLPWVALELLWAKGFLSSRVSGVAGSKTLSRSCPVDGSEDIPACNHVNKSSGVTPCVNACVLQTYGPAILCAESRSISTAQSKREEEQLCSNIPRPRPRRVESVSLASTPAANGQMGQTQSFEGD